ncbi:MAG: hypothetical protein ABSB61_09705 [Anaerolineales bacterium]|jgi:hypothetical protein
MSEEPKPVSNEHILEIRYKPNPRILDFRGTWAKAISEFMELPEWRIVENRLDVFSTDQSVHGFVGFGNCGLILLDTPTRNYFPDHATKLLKFLFELEGFGDPLFVQRLGVRSKFCNPYKGSFDDLRDRFSSKYMSLTEEARQAIGQDVKLLDIGAPLNFADKLGNFNTLSGPMVRDQFPRFFSRDQEFPDVGLYYDIDYWSKPEREIPSKEILRLVRGFSEAAWDRHGRLLDLILEG